MEYNVHVSWSGKYPCLCHGEWTITINKKKLKIPEYHISESMNTYGEYERWYFNDHYDEKWETYTDGLKYPEWIKENEWLIDELKRIKINENDIEDLTKDIYIKIQFEDFRHDSCGGCI